MNGGEIMPWGGRGFGRGWFGRGGYGFGRGGYGFWAQITGLPGWMRASIGLPAYGYVATTPTGFFPTWGRGNPYPFCRFFPWLPRWWWSGMYGPVQWTPQGPVLASQVATMQPKAPTQPFSIEFKPQMRKEQEIQFLEQELKAIEAEKRILEQELSSIRKRLKELKK